MKEKLLKIWKETGLILVILLLIVVGVRFVTYQLIKSDFVSFYDSQSYSYLEGYHSGFGEINSFRTPVYPTFLKFVGLFGDETTDELYARTAAFQEVISLASVAVFFLIMKKLTKNRITQSLATLYYGCLPSIFSYNLCILTESLAISMMVFFLYILLSYIQEKKIIKQIILAVLTTIMILLRPSFIYLFIFFAIFWIFELIFSKENRKKTAIGILLTCLSGACIFGYSLANEIQNGISGMSYVNVLNQADLIIDMGLYGTYEDNPVDEDITKMINETYNPANSPWYPVRNDIISTYGIIALDEYNEKCIKNNLTSYAAGTITRIAKNVPSMIHSIVFSTAGKTGTYLTYISYLMYPISFGIIFVIIAIEIIMFLWDRIKKKTWTKISQFRFYTMIILAGLVAVSLLAAQAEYQRLVSSIVSASIIILSGYVEKIFQKQEEKDFE